MSREIKYQAWIPELNKMVQVVSHNFEVGGTYFKDFNGREGFINNGVTLREYTGLKDKNGKEIFEGDIVQQNYKDMYNQSQAFAGEVVYSDCVYWLKNGGEYIFLYDEYRIYESVVIGNIYENPELLEETA